MFVFDGKTRFCYSEIWHEYRAIKSKEWILKQEEKECSKYKKCFTYWKYAAYGSVIIFLGSGIYLGKRVGNTSNKLKE